MSSTSLKVNIPELAGKWHVHSEGVGANLADLHILISKPVLQHGPAAGIDGSEIYTFTGHYTDPTPAVGVNPDFFVTDTFAHFTGTVFYVPNRNESAPIISMFQKGNSQPGSAAFYYYAAYIGRVQSQGEIDGAWLDISVPASGVPAKGLGLKLTKIEEHPRPSTRPV